MRKFFTILSVLCITALGSFAQSGGKTAKFSAGIDLGVPSGNVGSFYGLGIGASLKYEIPTAAGLIVTLNAGYESFMYKTIFKNDGYGSSDGYIPLKAGLKYYLNEGFYAEGQIGFTFIATGSNTTLFAFSPGLGYSFDSGFDAGVRYESWSKDGGTLGQIAFKVAYRF